MSDDQKTDAGDGITRGGYIVVGVDGSDSSQSALRRGAQLARTFDCTLRGVTVWDYPQGMFHSGMPGWSPEAEAVHTAEDAAAAVFGADRPGWYSVVVGPGPVSRRLIAEAEDAEMLIVGSRGLGGFAGLLIGSVSRQCAEHAHCPVLVVHDRAADRNARA